MNNVDVFLEKIDGTEIYDLVIDTDGDLKKTKGFDTSILVSLFAERRADSSEVSLAQNRRGWLGNEFSETEGFEIGSKIWLLEQARRDQETLNRLITYATTAFQWMIDDGHVDNIEVVGGLIADGMRIDIDFIRDGSIVDSKSFDIWNKTGDSFETI